LTTIGCHFYALAAIAQHWYPQSADMKIIAWNMRRASTSNDAAWAYFRELNADVALLQEITSIPQDVLSAYDSFFRYAEGKTGRQQKFGTAVLVKGRINRGIELSSEWDWVNEELERFQGNLVAVEVEVGSGTKLNVCSVYSPAWPIGAGRLKDADISVIKLKKSPQLWVTEILWAGLKSVEYGEVPWIVGGDLNSSVTFDYLWNDGPRGNEEIQERMRALGYVECLSDLQGALTPTFKNATGGKVIHQMDHLFVTRALREQCVCCEVGDAGRVFGESLSDHLPIVGEFNDLAKGGRRGSP